MNDIENQLFGSRRIREFLKNFSETQWSRIVKASVVMGIQEIEKSATITKLSAKDIEDLVVQNESQIKETHYTEQKSREFSTNQANPMRDRDSSLKKAIFSNRQRKNSNSPKRVQKVDFKVSENSEVPSTFRNSFKQGAIRRRDDQPAPEQKRASSLPTNQPKNQCILQLNLIVHKIKPPSVWRKPGVSNFMRNGCRENNRILNEEILVQKNVPRSKSLNPLIYPEWWGDQDVDTTATQENDESKIIKERKQAKVVGGRIRGDRDESSLDERLKAAKEAAEKLDEMFKNHKSSKVERQQKVVTYQEVRESHQFRDPTKTFYHNQIDAQRIVQQQVVKQGNKENLGPSQNFQGLVQQHSPPRDKKQKQKRDKQNDHNIKNNPIIKETQTYYQKQKEVSRAKQVPQYLRKVESRIKAKVVKDRQNNHDSNRSGIPGSNHNSNTQVEIYVKPKKEKTTSRGRNPQTQQMNPKQVPRLAHPEDPKYLQELSSNENRLKRSSVADIAEGFLASPLMHQFSDRMYGPDTPFSEDSKPQTITLQMSSTNTNKNYNHENYSSGNFFSQSQGQLQQQLQSTNLRTGVNYMNNPFSYKEEDFRNDSSQFQVKFQGRSQNTNAQISSVNNQSSAYNDTLYGNGALFKSEAFDQVPSQQHQISSQQQFLTREIDPIQITGQGRGELNRNQATTNISSIPNTNYSTKNQEWQQRQFEENQSIKQNPFQTNKMFQTPYTQQECPDYYHRPTGSAPFNYIPQSTFNKQQYIQRANELNEFSDRRTPYSKNSQDNVIRSPFSEDPNQFSQKYYNNQSRVGDIRFTQVLSHNPTTQFDKSIKSTNQHTDMSSSCISNYTQNDDLRGIIKQGIPDNQNPDYAKKYSLPAQEVDSSSSSSSGIDDSEQQSESNREEGDEISQTTSMEQSSYFSSDLSHSQSEYPQEQRTIPSQRFSKKSVPQELELEGQMKSSRDQQRFNSGRNGIQGVDYDFNEVLPPTFSFQKGSIKQYPGDEQSSQFQNDKIFHEQQLQYKQAMK